MSFAKNKLPCREFFNAWLLRTWLLVLSVCAFADASIGASAQRLQLEKTELLFSKSGQRQRLAAAQLLLPGHFGAPAFSGVPSFGKHNLLFFNRLLLVRLAEACRAANDIEYPHRLFPPAKSALDAECAA